MDEDNQELSLRDELVAAFDAQKASGDESSRVESSPSEPAPKETPAQKEAPKTPAAKDVRSDAPPADKAAPIAKAADAPAKLDKLDPPARWTKEEKEQFSALDPAVQKLLLGRNRGLEADYTKKMMAIGQERQRYAGIENILSPRRSAWTSAGINDEAALNQIFGYWDHAQKDPLGFITKFAQEKGIDLASRFAPRAQHASQQAPAAGADGQPQGHPVHPEVARELQTARQQIGAIMSHLNGRVEAESRTVAGQAKGEIDSFRSAVDDTTGEPLYPFFDDVAADMSLLIKAGKAETLKQAYSLAVRLNDDVSARIRESDDIKRRQEDEARRAAEADRARRASVSVAHSASGATHHTPASDDNDDSIRALLRRGFAAARSDTAII